MKKTIILSLLLICTLPSIVMAQEEKKEKELDTTRFSIGGTEIIIVNEVEVERIEGIEGTKTKKVKKPKTASDFNYWSGIDFGINGYFTDKNFGVNNDPDNLYMELNYAKSFNINLNVWEYKTKLIGERFLLTTGAGFRFNRYAFKNTNTTLSFNDTEVFPIVDSTIRFDKNFLNASYFTVPLMVTLVPGQKAKKSFHMTAGVIGGIRMGSRVKQRYVMNDQKFKDINRGTFHLNPFMLDATIRMGVGSFMVYGTYNMLPMFESNKGPDYQQFSVGITRRL
jgi:hypothetical protein